MSGMQDDGQFYRRAGEKNNGHLSIGKALIMLLLMGASSAATLYVVDQRGQGTDDPVVAVKSLRPMEYNFLVPAEEYADFEVVADINDVAITIDDVRRNHFEETGQAGNMSLADQRAAVERLGVRILLSQEAERQNLPSNPNFRAQVKSYYLQLMASRVLSQRLEAASVIPAADVRAYVEANPHLFEGRKRWHLEAIDMDEGDYQVVGRDALLARESLKGVALLLESQGRGFRRTNYSQYSEQVPAALLADFDRLYANGDIFITIENGRVRVLRIVSSDNAPITGTRRFDLARLRLQQNSRREALAGVERALLADIRDRLGDKVEVRYRENQPATEGGEEAGESGT